MTIELTSMTGAARVRKRTGGAVPEAASAGTAGGGPRTRSE